MNHKWTFFVSSTLEDLRAERQAVANQILKMEEIPIGMEQFGAINRTSWENIEKFIDTADYYILIIAGKYGSVDPSAGGISYTERGYRYAKSKGIPIIAILHSDPDILPGKYIEHSDEKRIKLDAFRSEVKRFHQVAFYKDLAELIGEISAAIPKAKGAFPRPGWVRHGEISKDTIEEMQRLRRDIDDRDSEIERLRSLKNFSNSSNEPDIGGLSYLFIERRLDAPVEIPVSFKKTDASVEMRLSSKWYEVFVQIAISLDNTSIFTFDATELLTRWLLSKIDATHEPIKGSLRVDSKFSNDTQYLVSIPGHSRGLYDLGRSKRLRGSLTRSRAMGPPAGGCQGQRFSCSRR